MSYNKDNEKVQVVQRNFPVLALLGAVLVVLKLLGQITISWVWVLAPFWIPWAIILGFLALGGLLLLFGYCVIVAMEWWERRR